MDASWVVVYVERSTRLSTEEKEQLAKNMKLAKELGAEVVTTLDENIAGALVRVAHEQNASLMLVGKPDRRMFSRAARLVDELIQKSKGLDIYIVGQEGDQGKRVRRMLFPGLSVEFGTICSRRRPGSFDSAFVLSHYAIHRIQDRIIYHSSRRLASSFEDGARADASRCGGRRSRMGLFLHTASIHFLRWES